MTRIAICIPAHDGWKAGFGLDLAELLLQLRSRPELKSVEIDIVGIGGSALPKSRTVLADRALKLGATHVLWLDCDMRFPPDTLIRFLAHKKSIVGANYRARRRPFKFTAMKGHEKQVRRRVNTIELDTGLEAVDYMGLGVMLIETRVFKAVPKPWFMFVWGNDEWVGEDCFFFRKAHEAGFQPHIDHDLSKQVHHIANNEMCFDSILED